MPQAVPPPSTINITVYSSENYSSWTNSASMNLNTSAAGVTSSQTDFPVLVRLTSANFSNFGTPGTLASLRFARNGTQHLKYQVDQWDSLGGNTAAIWVKVDNVAGNTTTPITMYWGNIGAVSHSNGPAVFNTTNGFAAAYHLGEATGSSVSADASPYGSGAKWFGKTLKPTSSSGVIGSALNFNNSASLDTSGAYLVASYNPNNNNLKLSSASGVTLSAWVNRTGTNNAGSNAAGMVSLWRYTASHKEAELRNTNATNVVFGAASNTTGGATDAVVTSTATQGNGTWYHVVGTFVNGSQKLYVNGASVGTSGTTASLPSLDSSWVNNALTIGKSDSSDASNKQYFYGSIDEVEMAKTVRSVDWINLSYKSQKVGVTPIFNLAYPQPTPTYTMGTPIAVDSPTVGGSATRFTISNGSNVIDTGSFHSATGMTFSGTTGKITGTPNAILTNAAFTVTAFGDSAWSNTSALTITVNSAPIITSNPANQVANPGGTVRFGVTVTSGLPLIYAWLHVHGGTTDTLKKDTLSALTDSLTLTSVSLADTGSYSVAVSNSSGNAKSNSATLSLNTPPAIASSPIDQTANLGSTVKLGVSINSGATTPLVYVWMHSHGGVTDTLRKDTLSTLTDTLTLAAAPLADTGSYAAEVRNAAGSVTSGSALLSLVVPPAIASNPSIQTVNLGSSIKFGVSVTSGASMPLVYAWVHSHGAAADTLEKDTLSGLTDSLTLVNVPLSDTGSYRAAVSNAAGSVTSGTAALLIVTTPIATPSSEAFLGSVPVTLATTSGAAIHYTTDGTTPTGSSTLYTGTITVTTTTTLEAIATLNSVQSPLMTQLYTLTNVATPTANPPGQGFIGSVRVGLSSATVGASLHYTTDGTTPDSTSTLYTDTLTLSSTTALKVIAVLNGSVSGILSQAYTLNTPPVISTAPHDTTVLLGAKAAFLVAATGPGTLHYQWQKNGLNAVNSAGHISGATAATLIDSVVAASDTGTYTVVVTDSLGNTATQTTSAGGRLIVHLAPVISSQPGAATALVGAIGSFSVTASGSGHLGYQWQRNGVNVVNTAGHISGATTASVTDSAVVATDTGTYTVIVTDTLNGSISNVTSVGVHLSVNTAPVISSQPIALTKLVGASASFSVTATGVAGGHLGYQWQKNGVNLSTVGTLSGVATSTLSNSGVASTDKGTYTVMVTDSLNGTVSSITSNGVFLTVNTPPVISVQPLPLTKSVGSSASFSVTASGPVGGHLGYQWKKNGTNLSNGGTMSGVTTATLNNSAVAATDTGTYTVLVTDTLNATVSSTLSTGAFLTLNSGPVISAQPQAFTKLVGSIGSFSVTASGNGTLSYQWQKNGVNVANSTGHLSGATTAILTDSSVAVGDTGTYTVVVMSTLNGTSSSSTSSGAFLTVNVAPSITLQPLALTKAVGAIGSFTVAATGSVTLSYQWQKNGVNVANSAGHISGATTATLTDSSIAAGDTGTYTVVVNNTLNGTTSTTTSGGAFLAVNVVALISAQPSALTRTLGSIGSFTITASGNGTLSYQWQKNGVNVANSGGHISGATTATLTDSSVAAADTGTYTVIVSNTLNGTTSIITSTGAFLTVNAPPSISTQPVAITKTVGAIGSLTVTASGSGVLSYQWQKNGVNVANSPGHISGVTTAILIDSAVAVVDSGTYIVVVTNTLNSTVSSTTSGGAYLTVNAAPSINSQPVALTKTLGGIGSFTVSATASGALSYQWQKNGVSVVNSAGHLSGATAVTLTDSSVTAGDTGTYTVIVSSTLNGVTSNVTSSGSYLTVNTAPVISTQPVALTQAVGGIAGFTVIAAGPAGGHLGYQWQKNGVNLSGSASLTGVTTASLRDSVAANDSGSYEVIVTDTLNGTVSTVTSGGAYLTVNTAPVISTQPVALTRTVGTIATFMVVATGPIGGHLGYQWRKNGIILNGGVSLTGVTSATLRDSVAATDSGTYTVIVTDTLNGTVSSTLSAGVYLTVNSPPTLTAQPVNVKVAAGGNATFSVTASGGVAPLSYQWFSGTTALSDTTGLAGSKTATLTLTGVAGPDSGRTVANMTVVVSSSGNVGTVNSSVATLTINASPKITLQPVDANPTRLGQSVSFSVAASKGVGPLVYQWFKSSTPLTDSGKVSGSKTSTLTLTTVAGADTGFGLYYVVIANVDSVGYATSNSVSLEIPSALLANAAKVLAMRTMGSAIEFQLPPGAASARISLMDVWGRSVWNRLLGNGVSRLIWSGSANGGGVASRGFYIVRMQLFDAQGHPMGLLEKRFVFNP